MYFIQGFIDASFYLCFCFCVYISSHTVFVEELVMHSFGIFVKNSVTVAAWVYFGPFILLYSSMCLFLHQYHAISVTLALWYN